MSLVAGMDEPIDKVKVKSHLNSIYKYNLRRDLSDHANPQRPTYGLGKDGGVLLCTWPKGGKLSLPFVYSDEVWTGIEYQVASHLIFEGEVEKGLTSSVQYANAMMAKCGIRTTNTNVEVGTHAHCQVIAYFKH